MSVVIIAVSTVEAELMAKDKSRTMTTRSASVKSSSASKPARNTGEGDGWGGTADEESDNSSNYEVEDSQGRYPRPDDVVFSKHDDGDFSQSGESTVDSLASMQQSSAAYTMPADSRSPAGVGQTAPTSFGAGADLQPAGWAILQ